MSFNKQVGRIYSFVIACILFVLGVWIAHKIQSAPDLRLPVEEIPIEYR